MSIRVSGLTGFLAGPFCTMLLVDLGAEVIKTEAPGVGDDIQKYSPLYADKDGNKVSGYFVALNRGKKSVTLNLKSERGKEVFKELVRVSDVVVDNFRPNALPRLGRVRRAEAGKPENHIRDDHGFRA